MFIVVCQLINTLHGMLTYAPKIDRHAKKTETVADEYGNKAKICADRKSFIISYDGHACSYQFIVCGIYLRHAFSIMPPQYLAIHACI